MITGRGRPSVRFITQLALKQALTVAGTSMGNLQLLDLQSGELGIVSHVGFSQEFLTYFQAVRLGDGSVCSRALMAKQPVSIVDVMRDEEFAPHRTIAEAHGFRGVHSTPLVTQSGLLVGVLSTHFNVPRVLTAVEAQELRNIAASATDEIVRELAGVRHPLLDPLP